MLRQQISLQISSQLTKTLKVPTEAFGQHPFRKAMSQNSISTLADLFLLLSKPRTTVCKLYQPRLILRGDSTYSSTLFSKLTAVLKSLSI